LPEYWKNYNPSLSVPVSEMLGEALSYPRRGEDRLKTIGIGGLLLLFGFLLVPAV
jgi:hypothetical protein